MFSAPSTTGGRGQTFFLAVLAGVLAHVIQCGHNRNACFFADEDYASYLAYLAELSTQFGRTVHAYVLMTNHVHLLLTPREGVPPPC